MKTIKNILHDIKTLYNLLFSSDWDFILGALCRVGYLRALHNEVGAEPV
jgi:hypothetical protein